MIVMFRYENTLAFKPVQTFNINIKLSFNTFKTFTQNIFFSNFAAEKAIFYKTNIKA